MTSFSITSPSSIDEALGLLATATPTIDSPTQRRMFSRADQQRTFERGVRKPEWVWAATTDAAAPLGVIAAYGPPTKPAPWDIDIIDLPLDQPEIANALFARAVADVKQFGATEFETLIFTPPTEDPASDESIAPLLAVVQQNGFRLLVVRRHYELQTADGSLVVPPLTLRFEPVTGADDPRLLKVFEEILEGSLDAHDVAALAESSPAEVATQNISDMVGIDGIDSFFLAITPDDDVAGLVVGTMRGEPGRGVASYIGVSHRHRGNGYSRQLLGWITQRVIDAGATFVIGETDVPNTPMAASFNAVGYSQTESRIDLTLD